MRKITVRIYEVLTDCRGSVTGRRAPERWPHSKPHHPWSCHVTCKRALQMWLRLWALRWGDYLGWLKLVTWSLQSRGLFQVVGRGDATREEEVKDNGGLRRTGFDNRGCGVPSTTATRNWFLATIQTSFKVDFFLQEPPGKSPAGQHLEFILMNPQQRTHVNLPRLLNLQNCEIVSVCYFKPLSLW